MSVFKGEMWYFSASSPRKHRADSKEHCASFGNNENHEQSSSSIVELSTDNKAAIDRQGDKRGCRLF